MTTITRFKQTSSTTAALALCMAASMSMSSAANAQTATIPLTCSGVDIQITTPGHYVGVPGNTCTTVSIATSDVVIDGVNFQGGGTTAAAVKNSFAGLANVTVKNSTFAGYTGRTITYGFAEGAPSADIRGSNWSIIDNVIAQGGSDATAIAMFNIDEVTLSGNRVTYTGAGNGRRGFNLDSSSSVLVTGNVLNMGGSGPTCSGVSTISPWGIQISMSDAPVAKVEIIGNTITGTFRAVQGLSQKNVTSLQVVNNNFEACRGVDLNTGGVAPMADLVYSGIKIVANDQVTIGGGATDALATYGVGLRDFYTTAPQASLSLSVVRAGGKVSFLDVKIHGNKVSNAAIFLRTYPTNPDVTYDVKATGNSLR